MRFAIVGCTNITVSMLVFFVFYDLIGIGTILLDSGGYIGTGIKYLLHAYHIESIDGALSSIIAYSAGTINSFVLNKSWTFKNTGKPLPQIKKFIVLNLIGLLFATLCVFVFVDNLGYSYITIWTLTIALTTVFNYFGNRYWTFSSSTIPTL